jgi:hypothetical protein
VFLVEDAADMVSNSSQAELNDGGSPDSVSRHGQNFLRRVELLLIADKPQQVVRT